MQLPDLTQLPPWAVVVFVLALAFIVAIGVFGERLGLKKTGQTPPGSAQVAAVIVDPAALNRATAAIEAMNMTMIEANGIAKLGNTGDLQLSDVINDLARTVNDLRGSVGDLRDEVLRIAAKMK